MLSKPNAGSTTRYVLVSRPIDPRTRQKAVTSISSVGGGGGGVTAALQSGALQFFKTFHYDRIGISCQLRDEVCLMSGLEPAKNGYYMVKGRGLPRIDIIGNAGRVDWRQLVAQHVQRWIEVTPSQFTHEAEGLNVVRALLPDQPPFRAWSNFEFRDGQGKWHEVDLLVLGGQAGETARPMHSRQPSRRSTGSADRG